MQKCASLFLFVFSIALIYGQAFIENCYSAGQVIIISKNENSLAGGLIAENKGIVNNSYWDMQTSGQNISSGGVGRSTDEMKNQTNYQNWDFQNIWSIDQSAVINFGYPYFSSSVLSSDYSLVSSSPIYFNISPNPCNPSTALYFDLNDNKYVRLQIFNIKGQLVKTLCQRFHETGNYSYHWNAHDNNGKKVASGVYLALLSIDSNNLYKKIIVLK